jgi:hypothetical protein
MVKAEPLTKEEFLSQMKELAQNDDIEIRHVEMDGLMMRQLASLGYDEAINVFIETEMWYA